MVTLLPTIQFVKTYKNCSTRKRIRETLMGTSMESSLYFSLSNYSYRLKMHVKRYVYEVRQSRMIGEGAAITERKTAIFR